MRDRPDLTAPEHDELVAALRREIMTAWATSEVTPAAADAARRSAQRPHRLRAEPLGRAAAIPAQRRPRPAREHGPRPANRRRADSLRFLDRRRSRRQPERHAAGDPPRVPAVAMGRRGPVSQGSRRPARRAVARIGHAGAARASRRRAGTVPRTAADGARPTAGDARVGRGVAPVRRGHHARTGRVRRFERVHGGSAPVSSIARRDRASADRRRAADRPPSARRGIRRHAGAHRHPSGRREAHRRAGGGDVGAGARLLRGLGRTGAPRVPPARACRPAAADSCGPRGHTRGAGRARHVPDDRAHACRVAWRVRGHDDALRVGRSRRRAAAEGGTRGARRCASSRCSRRRAICRTPAPSWMHCSRFPWYRARTVAGRR